MTSDWKEVKLEDITELICRGITPKYTNGNGCFVINQKCIRNGSVTYKDARKTDNINKPISNSKYTKATDTLICSTGVGTLGRVGYFKTDHIDNTTVDSHVTIVRVNNDIEPKFISYNLFGRQDEIESLAEGTTGQTELSRNKLGQLIIKLPSFETQQKIAKVLSEIDDKIELNNKINENLEQQAQAIFKSWFVNFEPFGGTMPEDWEECKIGDYVEIKRGGSPRPIQNYITSKGYKWLKISDATCNSNPYILEIKECIKETGLNKTVYLKTGNLVLSNSATPGIPKILDVDTCIHDGWLYFPSSKFSNEYLYLLFKSIRKELISLGNGSVFTNLKTDILRNFNTTLPNQATLDKFNKIIKPIFALIQNNQREVKCLNELRNTLLPKLMNGEIDVSNIDIPDNKLLFDKGKQGNNG